MKKKRWKTVAISMGTLFILSIVVFLVFRGHYQAITENIALIRITDLMLLLGLGVIYQTIESSICFVLVRNQLPDFTFRQANAVTYLGVFGNVSTFAVGSVPMQSYYLYCCGLMAGSGVGIMTLEYILHKSSVLVYSTAMLLMQGQWLGTTNSDLSHYMILGYVICVLITAALILLCTWKKILQLALWAINRLPDTEKWEQRKQLWSDNLEALYAEFQRIIRSPHCLRKVIALNGFKLFCLYSIPFLCFRMLNISNLLFWRVQLLAALMYLITNALPNIAGMGPTEFAFVLIFSYYMEYSQASSALILYRIATFFFPFLLSIIVFLTAQSQTLIKSNRANRTDTPYILLCKDGIDYEEHNK